MAAAAFGPESLPYGVFTIDGHDRRVGTRIGDRVVDLAAIASSARQSARRGSRVSHRSTR